MTPSSAPPQDDLIASIKRATADAAAPPRARFGGFSLQRVSTVEMAIAPLIGLYLGYAVVRLPEVFPVVAVPRGPMILLLLLLAILATSLRSEDWRKVWDSSPPLRLVAAILGIALATIPLGIWPTGSFEFLRQRYIISVAVFVICLVFLRDPRALRIAAVVFVLCAALVSIEVIRTYDPNAIVLDEYGDPLPEEVVNARADYRRLKSVGSSLDPNDFGSILATALPLALWLSIGSIGRRIFWLGACAVMIMAVVPTQSRGSMLGMLAAVTVVVGAGATGWRRVLTILMVGCAVAAFLYMAVKTGAGDRFSDFSGDDYNLGNEGRIFFWKQGVVWMLKRPWGYGIDNFATYFGILNGSERAAHSTWVQYGMELGIAGITCFGLLCAALVTGLRRIRRAALAAVNTVPGAAEHASIAGHMLAVLAGALVTGTFLSNAYYPLVYMALGMCAATALGSPFAVVHAPAPTNAAAEEPPSTGRRRRQLPTTQHLGADAH